MYTLILYLFPVTIPVVLCYSLHMYTLLHYQVLVNLFVVTYYACSALHIYFIVADIYPSAWSSLSRHHYMFMSITSPLDNLMYYIITTGYDYRLDLMITG